MEVSRAFAPKKSCMNKKFNNFGFQINGTINEDNKYQGVGRYLNFIQDPG